MIWIWLTVGMFARAVQLSVFNFKNGDLYTIPLAVGAGLFAVMEIAYSRSGDLIDPWAGLPLIFLLVIAFAFKDRLLPIVTEGTLFGYSLIASYLLLSSTYINGEGNNVWSLIVVTLLLGVVTFVIFYPRQASTVGQTILMIIFLCISIYIGYELAINTLYFSGSDWELIVIGYSCLALLANLFYILYFIPIIPKPFRRLSRGRVQTIREHAKDIEDYYIPVRSTSTQIFLTLILFICMLLLEYLNFVSDAFLISAILTFMVLVHTPQGNSTIFPKNAYKKL